MLRYEAPNYQLHLETSTVCVCVCVLDIVRIVHSALMHCVITQTTLHHYTPYTRSFDCFVSLSQYIVLTCV